jgi:peptidoglycan hydrolase-like protein with peptidoglycan-binding domain
LEAYTRGSFGRDAVTARRSTVTSTAGSITGSGHRSRPRQRDRLGRISAAMSLSAGLSTALVAVPPPGPAHAAPTAATRAAVAVPSLPAGLPARIENLAPYVGQISCDPTARPGTLALARLLTATYPGTGYLVAKPCGSEPIASEHEDGRALDWIVSARSANRKAQADAFLAWLLRTDATGRPFAAARRLGVMYVIWNNRIWSSHDPMPGWQPYSTCASHPEESADTVCNRNRVHVSLSWAGAMKRTSFWTKKVAANDYGPCRPQDLNWAPPYASPRPTPCPSYATATAPTGANATTTELVRFSGAAVGPGDTGPVVSAVQKALGVTADGSFGPFTADAVAAFQTKHGLPSNGRMNASTWRSLLVTVGARTPAKPAPPPAKTPSPKVPSAKNLTKYKRLVLKVGDHGEAVLALQRRLGATPDGVFGPKTKATVAAFQKSKKLPATGIVDAATWTALGA